MKKQINRVSLSVVLLTIFTILAFGSVHSFAQEKITLTLGSILAPKSLVARSIEGSYKKLLAEFSNGRINLETHFGGAICGERTCVDQVKMGQIDIGTISNANIGGFGKTFEITTLP